MAITASKAKSALDQISDRIRENVRRMQQAQSLIATADSDLAAMATEFGPTITAINAAAAAAPGDVFWSNVKAEKDKLVADFQAKRATSSAMKSAAEAITIE